MVEVDVMASVVVNMVEMMHMMVIQVMELEVGRYCFK